ncbi:glutamate synthase-related protein [Arcobacter sp.]|uniref:glutamate synthase-related protein n=1 Tax=unclassified Arcobacter TaxID=2593671 RepID=UPI003B003809
MSFDWEFSTIEWSIIILVIFAWYIHDKYVQRKHQLLVNYPIIGRLRFVLEEAREPFRQYFGDEKFYESKDKLDWLNKACRDLPNYASFSPSQPLPYPKFMIRHANIVLNEDEIEGGFEVTFGPRRKKPFISKSIIGRSAMSDGSISPEGTRAFAKGALEGQFPINTGEGSVTSNFFVTHQNYKADYMKVVHGTKFEKKIKDVVQFFFNGAVAADVYRKLVFGKDPEAETYIFDLQSSLFHRINWDAPLESFPKEVPTDLPDITFQISSGLYGARDKAGKFDPIRYEKVMRFCRMTEIKMAQGAKQTGGKLAGHKVTPAIAYYRGVEAYKDVFSPNRFPYANTIEELFDFIGQLQQISEKPVGVKIVISDLDNIEPYAKEIKKRIDEGKDSYPDYIAIDGGSGGSATAPIETMERVGLDIKDSIYLVDKVLSEYGVRDKIKLVASGKVLTPDDVIIIMSLGADFIQIARGFMMSAGCIRARYCSGTTGHDCPVGLATQNKSKRKKYFVHKQAKKVANYHKNLLKSVKSMLAIMGLKNVGQLNKHRIMFIDKDAKVYDNMDDVFKRKLKIGRDLEDEYHEHG